MGGDKAVEDLVKRLVAMKPEVDFYSGEDLLENGSLDSLDIVEIIDMMSNEFHIEIEPDDIDPENFRTVDAMNKMLKRYLK